MKISDNAKIVLEKRYLNRDVEGNMTETVEELFWRVSTAISDVEKKYDPRADTEKLRERFFDMMTNLEFLPNSPTLMNAGNPLGQLSACFVLPVEDSMNEIFEAIKQAALIHKSGGGTGFSFSRLRSAGSVVNSTGGVASGPISFMKVFNAATEAVKQGGTRRGANMGILRVDHPDIMEFITCKTHGGDFTNFNISVALTEKFMEAVKGSADYELKDPRTGEVTATLNAREVFDTIVDAAWSNGEPGIIFIDRLNRDNPLPLLGEIESTNPCGEQPLLPYESCNLGSINLVEMLKGQAGGYSIDYKKLGSVVDTAVHFLDNVIDANVYPIQKIEEVTKLGRKIGLGVMGFADILLMLGIPYDSEEAVSLADELMGFINKRGHEASAKLAEKRGTFPLFNESVYSGGVGFRNATVTTIAPTGTLSIIAGVSSGVEPVFAFAYIRNVMDNTELIETSPILREELERRGLYSEELMRRIISEGSLAHIEELPEDLRRIFVSAHDISPLWHIRMQAAFQNHTDNAVSKTVNFPKSATRDEVAEVYELAYETGCKGVTIYRDGSRDNQVLNIGSVKREGDRAADCENCEAFKQAESMSEVEPRERPQVTSGITERVKIGCGNLYITVNYDEKGICEIFTNTGRHGGCPSQSEATGRLASIALRSGVKLETIVAQLKGIRCPSTIRQPGLSVMSCPDAIARTIERVTSMQHSSLPEEPIRLQGDREEGCIMAKACPECGAAVAHEGGCITCRQCGYSKCN